VLKMVNGVVLLRVKKLPLLFQNQIKQPPLKRILKLQKQKIIIPVVHIL